MDKLKDVVNAVAKNKSKDDKDLCKMLVLSGEEYEKLKKGCNSQPTEYNNNNNFIVDS